MQVTMKGRSEDLCWQYLLTPRYRKIGPLFPQRVAIICWLIMDIKNKERTLFYSVNCPFVFQP